jgi:hypothetical protein
MIYNKKYSPSQFCPVVNDVFEPFGTSPGSPHKVAGCWGYSGDFISSSNDGDLLKRCRLASDQGILRGRGDTDIVLVDYSSREAFDLVGVCDQLDFTAGFVESRTSNASVVIHVLVEQLVSFAALQQTFFCIRADVVRIFDIARITK